MNHRSISSIVLTAKLDIPAISARLSADWERDIASQLFLEPGDVEELPLARSRLRWPDFSQYVQTIANWTHGMGIQNLLCNGNMALMACRGARYHHDALQYGGFAFCNLFLSEDKGLDLHFPDAEVRIPLTRGTAVIFDTGQTHAVIKRGSKVFNATDFPSDSDCSLVFLTWELPIENPGVMHALQIAVIPR
jgi:hypothetical protein